MTQHRPEPTVTLRLHALLRDSPILPENFGKLPVKINGKAYMATITRVATDETGSAVDLWMDPADPGPDGPLLLTREELHLADLG